MRCTKALAALFLPLLFVCPVRSQATDPTADATAAADAAFQAKQYDSAIAAYQAVESASTDAAVKARAHCQIAECYGKKGDRAKARGMFIEVADAYPGQPTMVAKALLRAGDYALADEDLNGAVAPYERMVRTVDPGADPVLRETVAQAAVHVARIRSRFANDAAIPALGNKESAAWQEAQAKRGKAKDAWMVVASVYADRPFWAAEAKLNLLEIKQQDALFELGGSQDDVIAGAEAFLKEYPEDAKHGATARLIKAESQYFVNRFDPCLETLAAIDASVASPLVNGTAHRLLAQCYERKHDYARALAEYTKFLDGNEPSFIPHIDRPLAQYGAGVCLRALGRKAEAQTAFAKVKEDYPTSGFAQAAESAAAGLALSSAKEQGR